MTVQKPMLCTFNRGEGKAKALHLQLARKDDRRICRQLRPLFKAPVHHQSIVKLLGQGQLLVHHRVLRKA